MFDLVSGNSKIKILLFWFRMLLAVQVLLIGFIFIALLTQNVSPNIKITIYGIQSIGLKSPLSLLLLIFLSLHLILDIGILLEKSNAVKYAKYNYQFGLIVCAISILFHILFPTNSIFKFPLYEFPLIVFLLFCLKKAECKWNSNKALNEASDHN